MSSPVKMQVRPKTRASQLFTVQIHPNSVSYFQT